jgi:hypothetical protein
MADYKQTHVVPSEGLPAWAGPDGSVAPAANLDPGLDVMLIETRSDWAHIRCSNGWEAWVDNRRLIVSPPAPVAAAPPPPKPPSPAQEAPPPPAPTQQAPPFAQPAPPPPPTQPAAAAPPPTQQTPTAPPPTQQGPTTPPPTQPVPPSAGWGTPGAAPGAPRAARGRSIGPGQIIALVGGLLYFVAAWFPWLHLELLSGAQSVTFSAYEIPGHFLLDSQSELGGLSLGIVIAFFGFACIAAAVVSLLNPRLGLLSLIAGGAAFLVTVLFLVQTKNFSDALPGTVETGYFSILRFGAYIALVGAILALVGGVLTLAQKRS